jgi:hypothetical protein
MKTAFALIAISFLAGATSAHAEFTFACGANSDQGVEQAQVAFVDSLDAPMKLLLAGHPVADEKLGVKSLDKGRWLVSVDEGANLGVRQYVFVQGAAASVQLSRVSEKGDLMKGAKLPCLFVQK